MPSTNLRLLEQRFIALEKREQRLEQASASRRRQHTLSDPHVEGSSAHRLPSAVSQNNSNNNVGSHDGIGGLPDYHDFGSNRYALQQTELLSGARNNSEQSARTVNAKVSQQVLSIKQKATAFFEREEQNKQAQRWADASSERPRFLESSDDALHDDLLPLREGHAVDRRAQHVGDDGAHFVPLFASAATPTPVDGASGESSINVSAARRQSVSAIAQRLGRGSIAFPSRSGGGEQEETEETQEDVEEEALISKMMYTDAQRSATSHHAVQNNVPTAAMQRNPPATLSSSASQVVLKGLKQFGVGYRPQSAAVSSSFANTRPIRVRVGSAGGQRAPSVTEQHQSTPSRPLNSDRLVKAFFEHLPPAVPYRGVSAMTRRYENREEAKLADAHQQQQYSPSRASEANVDLRPPSGSALRGSGSPPRHRPPPAASIPPFAMASEYYHLQIKIAHAAASLLHWRFTVSVTDVTDPKSALPRHQFHGLKVNNNRHIIFQPPDSVTLDPLRQLPWVVGPSSLYGHTLRIEVFATQPLEAKVVDTMVHYGSS